MLPDFTCVPADDRQAVRDVFTLVGGKWSLLVIGLLCHGPRRFSDIRRTMKGISQRMLTLTLRTLERDGLVTRTVYPTVPSRVEYALTPLGMTLLVPVQSLVVWATTHRVDIQAARNAHPGA